MSYRCEDAPCCGCGPEGCVDFSRTVNCIDCGKEYHPDQNTESYCYSCQRPHSYEEEYWPDSEEDFGHDYY